MTGGKDQIHKNARGQLERSDEGRRNSGVSSAKPHTFTHSDDAATHARRPVGNRAKIGSSITTKPTASVTAPE